LRLDRIVVAPGRSPKLRRIAGSVGSTEELPKDGASPPQAGMALTAAPNMFNPALDVRVRAITLVR
jgi:hypothetical protein